MAVRATARPSITTRCAGCTTSGWSTPVTAPAVRWRRRGARPDPGAEPRYPGTCRDRGLSLADGVGWRVRLPAGVEAFDDALLGRQEQSPAEQCGDMLIRDRLGNWTYQFAVTVDDWRQGVDLVIRGVDLLPSTGRQIQLARLLGREVPPIFMHHPLVMKTPDQKLSKSDRATGIRDLRAAGWTREQVLEAAGDNRGPAAASRV